MKRAAGALFRLTSDIADSIGPEGAFLLLGAALLAIGSSYISAAGPWLVLGAVSLALGIALAVPSKS